MAYRFRLAPLLQLREQTRDERRRDLAQAYEALRLLEEQERELARELEENRNWARKIAANSALRVDELTNTRRYEAVLKMRGLTLAQQKHQVQEELERRRQALTLADREVKVLEKLREKQLAHYEAVQQKREDQRLDEAALRGFQRNLGLVDPATTSEVPS